MLLCGRMALRSVYWSEIVRGRLLRDVQLKCFAWDLRTVFTLDASQQHLWHDVDYHKKINFTYFCGCFFFNKKVQFVVTARQYKPMEQRFHCKSRIVELMFVIKALMWKISVYYLTVKSSLWSGTMFILINWLHQYYTDVIRQVCSMWTVSFWYSWTKSPPLAMCVWR